MCMTGVHILFFFSFFFLYKEYSNLSKSGGVKICSLCPQLYIKNVMQYCSVLCISHRGALRCRLKRTRLYYCLFCPKCFTVLRLFDRETDVSAAREINMPKMDKDGSSLSSTLFLRMQR